MLSPGHTAGQGPPEDMYTWGHVHLGMCAPDCVHSTQWLEQDIS